MISATQKLIPATQNLISATQKSFPQLKKSFPQPKKSFRQLKKSFPQAKKSFRQPKKSFPQAKISFPQAKNHPKQPQTISLNHSHTITYTALRSSIAVDWLFEMSFFVFLHTKMTHTSEINVKCFNVILSINNIICKNIMAPGEFFTPQTCNCPIARI